MSREVRKVPANWEHPKDAGGKIIPLYPSFPYKQSEIEEGLKDGWLEDCPPHYGLDIMPDWPETERTHWQMYESVTEGTPISPVMESPEALARWLADNKASAGPYATASYQQWLAMIDAGFSVGTFARNETTGERVSGVEAVSRMP